MFVVVVVFCTDHPSLLTDFITILAAMDPPEKIFTRNRAKKEGFREAEQKAVRGRYM